MTRTVLLLVLVSACSREEPPPLPRPKPAEATAPLQLDPERQSGGCRLTIPRSETLNPYVFPTLDGATEFDNAIISRSDSAIVNTILRAQSGFAVQRGTRCSVISEQRVSQLDYAKVRIIDGPFAGRIGWLPTSQAQR